VSQVDDKYRVERDQASPRPHFRCEEIRPSNTAPVRLHKRLPRRRALRHRRQSRRFQNPANRRSPHTMADIGERALDPRVSPRRILCCHAQDELTDLEQHTSWSGFPGVRPLPGDQLTMPPQQRVRGNDRGNLAQRRTTESVRQGGQPAAIVVRKTQRPVTQLMPVLSQIAAEWLRPDGRTLHAALS
jgi:hypothetical protein